MDHHKSLTMTWRPLVAISMLSMTLASAARATAQPSLNAGEALTQLLDAQQTRTAPINSESVVAAIRDLFNTHVSTVPVPVSSGSLIARVYGAEPGELLRTSAGFGSLYIERPITSTRRQWFVSFAVQHHSWSSLDGHSLADGDIEVKTVNRDGSSRTWATHLDSFSSTTAAITASVGLTDNLDVATTIPIVDVELNGRAVQTDLSISGRTDQVLTTPKAGRSTGLGDWSWRAKYRVTGRADTSHAFPIDAHGDPRREDDGMALVAKVTLSSAARAEQLLGAGSNRISLGAVASHRFRSLLERVGASYVFGGGGISVQPPTDTPAKGPYRSCDCGTPALLTPINYEELAADVSVNVPSEFDYSAGTEFIIKEPVLTISGDVLGRVINHSAALTDFTWTSPTRLDRITEPFLDPKTLFTAVANLAVRWRFTPRNLLTLGTLLPTTNAGLRSRVAVIAGYEYAFTGW